MKKFILLLLIILATSINIIFAAEMNLRDYDEFDVPAGTHLSVINLQEFSSAYCEEGDKVYFKTTSDIYLYDKNVIPEGTLLQGYIDKKHEPIIGTHAALRIFVNKMYLEDGFEVPIKGYVYSANDNMLGGGLTMPAKYINMPHYQRWTMFRAMGTLQSVPGGERKMGEHLTISSGANLIIVLSHPIHMTHTIIH